MKYTIEIEKVYEDNDLLNILHHIGFKGIMKHKETGEIVAGSSSCSKMQHLVSEYGSDYEYKESY